MNDQRYHTRASEITALQWTGDNLSDVQIFTMPHSPLLDGKAEGKARVLIVNVLDAHAMKLYPSLGRQVKGMAVSVGDWIVRRDDGDLEIVVKEEFAQRYALADGPATAGTTPAAFPLGGAIAATHPRRFADRLPEEGERPSQTLKDA